MKKVYTIILSLVLLTIFSSNALFSGEKPNAVSPFPDNGVGGIIINKKSNYDITLSSGSCLQNGGNRLVTTQNDDGGWGWPLNGSSAPNTIGPIGMGLANAFYYTGYATQKAALEKLGSYLLKKLNNFSPSDGYIAARLDIVFGVTSYTHHVKTNFYDKLASGTYNRNGAGTLYNTADYVNSIRTSRASQGIPNLAAWDVGMGLVAAIMCGSSDLSTWVTGVEGEINELDGNKYYDVIGLAGALYSLSYYKNHVNGSYNFDPSAGKHSTAASLADLAAILANYQITSGSGAGGFTWSSNYIIPDDYNETIQETAYSILALNEVNRSFYLTQIMNAADYMKGVQLSTGGWENYLGSGENNEVTAEALWGIAVAYCNKWVSTTGNNANDGSYENPYRTLQHGINQVCIGGTVNVMAGTYEENKAPWVDIVLNKSLSIIGAGSGKTIIQFTGKQHGLEITPDAIGNVWIEGISFTKKSINTKSGEWAIIIGETGGTFNSITLKDVEVGFASARNVAFLNATYKNILIENCNIHHSWNWGLSARGTINSMTVANSHFDFNGWIDLNQTSQYGIGFDIDMPIISKYLNISGSTFNNNSAKGINIVKTENATFTDIIANKNGGHPGGGFGVCIWEWSGTSQNLKFIKSTLSENTLDGLLIGSETGKTVSDILILNSVLTNNSRSGIFIYRATSWGEGIIKNVSVKYSNISSNGKGIDLTMPYESVDATCNWWGTTDPCVIKDRVSGLVNIAPYLTNGTDNEPGTPGFQPVPGSCNGNTNLVQNINTGKWFCAIQPAINDASTLNGHTIEVYEGTYNENVTINKSLTVRGKNPPTNTALITGKVNITADNVTLENFKIDPPDFTPSYDAAIKISSNNIIIRNNIITDIDGPVIGETIKAIHIYKGGSPTISNIKIEKNIIENISNTALGGAVGVAVQGFVDKVDILDNEFNNIVSGAWGYGIDISPTDISTNNTPTYVNVLGNLFVDINKTYNQSGTPYPGVAVLIGKTNTYSKFANPTTYKINFNNFTGPTSVPAGVANSHTSNPVNAEYNWWGHCNGPTVYPYTTTYGSASSGLVNYDPWLGNSLGGPALWLSSINAKRHGDERLSKWLSMDCGNREAIQNAPNRQPIYADGWVKFESDYGVNKYGFSDVMEVTRYGDITATDVENTIDKWHPSKEKKNLFVTFKTGSSVDAETQPPVYYRDGRQCIFEAGGPLSGYNLYIVSGKLVFGMWNRFESKYTILENSSLYPLSANKTYYGYLNYDGTKFQAVLSDGSTITPSPEISFAGISQDAEDKTGIGGAARTRYHDYSVGSTYSDEFDGLLGDIIIYSGEFTKAAAVNSYLFARYGVPSETSPRISTQDWVVISDIDKTGDNAISSSYPNPFSHKTSIGVNLTNEQFVNVELLDLMGRKVLNVFKGKLGEGIHDIEIDGTGLSSGIYFIKVAGEMFTQTTQVILNR